MKLSELRTRESLDERLEATLMACARRDASLGEAVSEGTLERWYEHPFFSVFVRKGFCEAGRRYLRAQYQHSPDRKRRVLQAAAVGVMAVGPVFDRALKAGLMLPGYAQSTEQMWMIGNHRVRRFDFARRRVRVYPKVGFSPEGIRREIAVRSRLGGKWIQPILEVHEDVFEEPLLDAVPLDRVPDEVRRAEALDAAAEAIGWLNRKDSRELSGAVYIAARREAYEGLRARVYARFAGLDLSLVDEMFSRAEAVIRRAMRVEVGMTHGDFQPGNVLVSNSSASGHEIWLIDWEDAGERATVYDVMTWHLQSRRPAGLSERGRSFLSRSDVGPFSLSCSAELAVAMWAVEEWLWLLEASSREGISRVPQGLGLQFRELSRFLKA